MTVTRRLAGLLLPALVLTAAPALAQGQAQAAQERDKVVYHIDDAAQQGTKALRNIRNHLDVAPETQVRVVTHADGIDLLLEGAKDTKNDIEYGPLIADLKARGVAFEVCEITIGRRKLGKDAFVMEAEFTRSGVLRITQLQSREHYAYIKP